MSPPSSEMSPPPRSMSSPITVEDDDEELERRKELKRKKDEEFERNAECHNHYGMGGIDFVTVRGTITKKNNLAIVVKCAYKKYSFQGMREIPAYCDKTRKIRLHQRAIPDLQGLLSEGTTYLFMGLKIERPGCYKTCDRSSVAQYKTISDSEKPFKVPFKFINPLIDLIHIDDDEEEELQPLVTLEPVPVIQSVVETDEEEELKEEEPLVPIGREKSFSPPIKKTERTIGEEIYREKLKDTPNDQPRVEEEEASGSKERSQRRPPRKRGRGCPKLTVKEKQHKFALIQNLAMEGIIGGIGPACISCYLIDPFKKLSVKKKVRQLLKFQKSSKSQKKEDHEKLVHELYRLGNFSEQLTDYGKFGEKKCKQLMKDFLPLVVGGGELEAYVCSPGLFPPKWGNRAIDIGLRRPINSTPLDPGVIYEIYGNLHPIGSLEESMEKHDPWKLVSTIQIKDSTHQMLGPIQLANHDGDENANAQYFTDRHNKVFLQIIKTVEPGEAVLVNYGAEYENIFFEERLLNGQQS